MALQSNVMKSNWNMFSLSLNSSAFVPVSTALDPKPVNVKSSLPEPNVKSSLQPQTKISQATGQITASTAISANAVNE